ncbi:response regulator [Maribellus sp. CM-23]|uniref:ATP-binding protein n=1 Tax=Maribellus sp. CM-23 TaxID=2781026 RepID=UPI001F483560|nr:ATP-binding protein [Maribellus sp. CM-23]MCE4563099.1 response regulator [Maribellus sp. CM-23]
MKYVSTKDIIVRIDRYLADPRLDAETQLRKRWAWIWMVVTCVFVAITSFVELVILKLWPIWWFGFIFWAGYLIGFPLYRRMKRFDLVINILFTVFIVAALFAMLQTGGISTSLGFIFIGMNCAMGSMLAGNLRWTIGMFVTYCVTIIILGLFQSSLTTPEYITPRVNTLSFVGLTVWINACILLIVILFMKDKSRYEKSEAEKLRKIDEAKTKLFTNVSHEFRTPLTVIQGIAEQMEQHPEKWMQSGPGKIKMQSQLLLRLVNQMLNIAKIEADEMHLELIHGDICRFIRYVAGTFQSLADSMKVELILNQQEDPIYTDYDPDKLMHVLSNLLSNAIKFTPPGGLVCLEVSIAPEKNKEVILISVRDTGRGIPEASVSKIFERFYQVPDKHDQTSGTGLGLAVTYELIKLMNGKISVESREGKGSVFTVLLPVSKTAEKAADHGVSMISSETAHAGITKAKADDRTYDTDTIQAEKPVLLIVEDNKDVVEYLQTILQKEYNLEIAPNGEAGYEKAMEIIPDIILSDVMMPLMDGFEMLEKLKADIRTDHIPVVILTARGDFNSKLAGLAIGADHYLIKPFNEKELRLKLGNLLELRRKMQKHFGTLPFQPQDENSSFKPEGLFIKRINALIEKEMGNEDFGINDICFSMNMSRAQLYRKFSAITNNSIGKYLRSFRLYKAKELLENQGKNVTETAFETGFKNLSHFSTCFHEEFGFSPNKLVR